jgi:hypothetical protein
MSVDHIRYDLLTQEALRRVIRTVLVDAASKGLPGEHHFFVTFDTRAEGVRMSTRLKASYPDDMTIVLQHQFWDLIVGDDEFEVGLAFHGIPERLHIPFKAVKAFFDPSVQFGLQFTVEGMAEPAAIEGEQQDIPGAAAPTASPRKRRQDRDKSEKKDAKAPPLPVQPVVETDAPAEAKADTQDDLKKTERPASGGEVVRLDRFRKK